MSIVCAATWGRLRTLAWAVAIAAVWPGVTRALVERDAGRIIVVPIVQDGAPAPGDWRNDFAEWAGAVWSAMTRGQVDLRLDTAPPIRQWPCSGCRIDPFDMRSLRPWVDLLVDRHRRAAVPPDAWLLLLPPDTLVGDGVFLPARWLGAALGEDAFDLLIADGPVPAMHELGHFLGLPDRYDPHGQPWSGELTLMGWTDEPLAPPDPILLAARGWAELRAVPPPAGPFRKTLQPGQVLRVAMPDGDLWLALSALPGRDGPAGWIFEVDRGAIAPPWFERVTESLYGVRQPGVGALRLPLGGENRADLGWQFIPSPPRLVLDLIPVGDWASAPLAGCGTRPDGAWSPVLATLLAIAVARVSRRGPPSVRMAARCRSVRPPGEPACKGTRPS